MNLVSIIIPVYNVSEFLDKCVLTACKQTYSNIEIILVDDGSTDDSGWKCDEWAKKDNRIKVIHKTNGGLSSARNAGLDIATGTYIYFCDSDDYIELTLLEKTISHMDDGYDMVVFGYNKVHEDGTVTPLRYHDSGIYKIDSLNEKKKFLLNVLLKGKLGWEAWSRLYRRDVIEKYDLRFVDNKKIFAEDLYFCLCYCAHIKKILSLDTLNYFYRQRENSIMGQDSVKMNAGRMNELAKAVLEHYSINEDCKDLVNIFPIIHFMILDSVVHRYSKTLRLPQVREALLKDLSDVNFYMKQTRLLLQTKELLYQVYPINVAKRIINTMQYYIDGNYIKARIRYGFIWLTEKMYNKKENIMKYEKREWRYSLLKKRKIFLIGTEDFGNIGDHKIAESIIEYLREKFPKYDLLEITASEYNSSIKKIDKYIGKKDIIALTGGGNLGSEYIEAPKIRRDAICRWKNNVKIVFPQTVYFDNTENGIQQLNSARKIYTKENNVIIFAREKTSFEFIKNNFSCDSYLVPDIVLYFNEQKSVSRQNVVRLCMRNDNEKITTSYEIDRIYNVLNEYEIKIETMDLQLEYHVSKKLRKEQIEEKLQLIRSAKFIITDRLHGMIFAAITGTPCIALNNYNYKISGTYEWINYLPYIFYIKDISEFEECLYKIFQNDEYKYDNSSLMQYFQKLEDIIKLNV